MKVGIIGGGVAGLTAAKYLSNAGFDVVVFEAENQLGGKPIVKKYYKLTPDFAETEKELKPLIEEVQKNSQIILNTKVQKIEGKFKDFRVIANGKEYSCDVVLLACGFEHFDASKKPEYNYKLLKDVITGVELEDMLHPKGSTSGQVIRPSNGKEPEVVVFIQCVGSRDRQVGQEFCCRVGCVVATKQAIEIHEKLKNAQIYIFYMDIRAYGRGCELLYWKAQEEAKIRYIRGRVGEVSGYDGKLLVKAEDTLMNRPIELLADLVVLTVGMTAGENLRDLLQKSGIECEDDGFVKTQSKMNPFDTTKEGIFAVGCCSGPKLVEDCIIEGMAVAQRIICLK